MSVPKASACDVQGHTTVSVVVPTRNRRALLAMTLGSVLRQRRVELDVIVVDEASSDGTAAMLNSLGDGRVRVIHHETPRGVSLARNHGAEAARGEWLAFVDDDDVWAPDKLAWQLDAARSAGRDWAYAGTVSISEHNQIVGGHPPLSPDEVVASLPHYNAIPGGGSNVIVRRSSWLQAGPFDPRLRNTEDWEMWIRLAKQGPPACVSRPLVGYRVHGANASLDIAEIVRGTRLIEALHQTTADWGRLHRWLAESCLRNRRRAAALGQFAMAAAHGEAIGTLSDLAILVRRRLTPFLPARQAGATRERDVWTAAAEHWLAQVDIDASVAAEGRGAAPTTSPSGPTA